MTPLTYTSRIAVLVLLAAATAEGQPATGPHVVPGVSPPAFLGYATIHVYCPMNATVVINHAAYEGYGNHRTFTTPVYSPGPRLYDVSVEVPLRRGELLTESRRDSAKVRTELWNDQAAHLSFNEDGQPMPRGVELALLPQPDAEETDTPASDLEDAMKIVQEKFKELEKARAALADTAPRLATKKLDCRIDFDAKTLTVLGPLELHHQAPANTSPTTEYFFELLVYNFSNANAHVPLGKEGPRTELINLTFSDSDGTLKATVKKDRLNEVLKSILDEDGFPRDDDVLYLGGFLKPRESRENKKTFRFVGGRTLLEPVE